MHSTAAQSVASCDRPPDPLECQIGGSVLLVLGRGVSLVVNCATQVVIVRYLAKGDYGAFAFGLSVVAMVASLNVLGLPKAIARFAPIYEERREYSKLFGAILLATGTMICFGAVLLALAYGLRGPVASLFELDPLPLSVLLTLIVLAPFMAFDSLLVALFAAFVGARSIFWRRHVLGPALTLTAVLAVVTLGGNVHQLAIAYMFAGTAAVTVFAVVLYYVMRRKGMFERFRYDSLELPARDVFGMGLPFFSSDLAFVFRGSLVVILLGYFRGVESVAPFQAVLPIAALTKVVLVNFSLLFIPAAARLLARNQEQSISETYWRTAIWITVLTFPVFAVTCSLAGPVTVLLFGERYADSAVILALLSAGYFSSAMTGLSARMLKVFGKVRSILAIELAATLFALGICVGLIPRFGAVGGAVGCCLSLVVYNVLNQLGLVLGTPIRAFPWRCVKVYLVVVLSISALLRIQAVFSPPVLVSLLLVAAASLAVLLVSRDVLDIETTFPRLARVPLVRRYLGAPCK